MLKVIENLVEDTTRYIQLADEGEATTTTTMTSMASYSSCPGYYDWQSIYQAGMEAGRLQAEALQAQRHECRQRRERKEDRKVTLDDYFPSLTESAERKKNRA